MEKITAGFSNKDIPLPTIIEFKKSFLVQANNFIRNLRWRAFFYGKSKNEISYEDEEPPKYPFKSRKYPPTTKELDGFEKDLLDLTQKIKPKKHPLKRNKHIQKLHNFLRNTRNHGDLVVESDKTRNLYKVKINLYLKLIRKEIHKSYKKVNRSTLKQINNEHYLALLPLDIVDKTEPYTPKTPRIILKDHKLNFESNRYVRLICPSKSDLGIVSKTVLSRIIPALANKNKNLSIWWNTKDTLDWFNKLPNKKTLKFLQLDIDNYYNSINQNLLNEALQYAMTNSDLTEDEAKLVNLARKTLIEFEDQLWARKDTNDCFDIMMGSADSAQVTDLIGIFLLKNLADKFPQLIGGLYRDDALFVLRNASKSQIERTRKQLKVFFNSWNLNITFEYDIKTANFLDSTLNLSTGLHAPFHKQNECLSYVHRDSNHPKCVTKAIVKSVTNRISTLSASEGIFYEHAQYYENALAKAGYTTPLKYIQKNSKVHKYMTYRRNNEQPRDISGKKDTYLWFNPPYGVHIGLNIAEIFFKLIDRHFPPGSKLHPIVNRNTVRLSFSTTSNMKLCLSRINNKKIRDFYKLTNNTTNPNPNNHFDGNNTRNNITHINYNSDNNNDMDSSRNNNNNSSIRDNNNIDNSSNTTTNNNNNNNINNHIYKPVLCNCLVKSECPLQNKCLTKNIIYKAKVTTNNNNTKIYIGSTMNTFKKRLYQHRHNVKNLESEAGTALTHLIKWYNKEKVKYKLEWSLIKQARPYTIGDKFCDLCVSECLAIISHNGNLINSFSETLIRCRHKIYKTFSGSKQYPIDTF